MQLPPVEVLASWPTPNYVSPETRGPVIPIITFVLFPIALTTVALRAFTRLFISKSFGVDDWFLLAAIIPTIACAVLTILAAQRWGWNRHIWDVPPDLVTLGLKLTITLECTFALAVSLTKMSMLILTRRILTTGTSVMHHIAAFLMFVVAADAVIFCLVVIFSCSPPSAYWTLSAVPQKCINEKLHLVISGSINTFTDFGVVLLPLPPVLSLKINRNQQMILGGLFGAGFAICVAGCFRIYYEFRSAETFDRTWVSFGLWISSLVELYVGVICTAMPACRPFFSRYIPNIFGSTFQISSPSHNYVSTHQKDSLRRKAPFISQERRFSQSSEHFQPHELQNIPKSKLSTIVLRNSKDHLTLSYMDTPGEKKDATRMSNETSISSFVGRNPSPASLVEFHVSGPSALERGAHRSESIEELVEPPHT